MEYSDAIDAIYGILNQAWLSGAQQITGYVPEIRWPGVTNAAPESQDKFWARPSFTTVSSKQSSLANNNGAIRSRTVGLFYVQIFCPKSADQPLVAGRQLAELVRDGFLPPSGNELWFRDQTIQDALPSATLLQINVKVTCTFDTVRVTN